MVHTRIFQLIVDINEETEVFLGLESQSPLLKEFQGCLLDFRASCLRTVSLRPMSIVIELTGSLMIDDISSTNSLLAISARKWSPPFLMHKSVSCSASAVYAISSHQEAHIDGVYLRSSVLAPYPPLEALHGLLGKDSFGPDHVSYL